MNIKCKIEVDIKVKVDLWINDDNDINNCKIDFNEICNFVLYVKEIL